MKKAAIDPPTPKPRKTSDTTKPAKAAAKPPGARARKTAKKSAAEAPEAVPESAVAPPDSSSASLTVIAARVDIGFGNHLFLRGTGPGLSWETGVPMANAGSDLWTIDLMGATSPVHCKFLINDALWSAGPDYVVDPGAQLEVTPLF